jgi:hypothetical protein
MTGVATYYRDTGQMCAFECAQMDASAMVWSLCAAHRDSLAIGWEKFTITGNTAKFTRAGSNAAIEVIGVCRWAAHAWSCTVLPAAQQHTPDAADQHLLKSLGWWVPGKDDAQSAAAHLVRWMLRSNQAPPVVAAAVQMAQGSGRQGT